MQNLIFDIIVLFFLILNTIILFYLSSFLVRLREEQKGFFIDVLNVLGQTENSLQALEPDVPLTKNWDQKYEEELNEVLRRSRQQNGLMDLDQ